MKNNLNYQIALKNIEIAKTYVTESKFNYLPELDIGYTVDRFRFNNNSVNIPHFNPSTQTPIIGFDYLYASVAYDADLWAKKVNITNQAVVNVSISEAESRSVKLTLISEVVNVYFQIATINANLNNLTRQAEIINADFKILMAQYNSGYTNVTAVRSASNRRNAINRDIIQLYKTLGVGVDKG